MEKIRLKIQEILNGKDIITVNRESNIHLSGVYMLYIDDLFEKNILPFYIGKSKDIQKRYFEHLEKVLLLNKLDSDYLNKIILDDVTLKQFYSGYYLYIKIYKFMIENKKNLDDIKMILLEETEEEYLFEREEYFIDSFKAPYVGFNQFNSRTKRFTTIEERNKVINIEMKEIPKWLDYGYTKFNLDVVYTSYLGNLLQSEAEYLPYSDFYKDLVVFIEKYVVTIKELSYLINLTNLRNESIMKKINSVNMKEKIINEIYSEFFQWAKTSIVNFEKEFRYRDEREKVLASILVGEQNNYLNINKFKELHIDSFEQYKLYEKNERESIKRGEEYTEKIFNEMNKTFSKIKLKKKYNSFSLKSLNENESFLGEKKENTVQLFILLGNNGRRKNSESFIIKIEMHVYKEDGNSIEKEWYVKNDSTIAIKNRLYYVESDLYYKDALSRNLFGTQPFKIIPEEFRNYISTNVELRYGINDYSLKNKELINFGSILNELELLVDENTELYIKISEGPTAFKIAMEQIFDFSFDLDEQFKDNKILNDLRKKVPKNRQLVLNKQVKKKSNRKPKKIKEISEEEMKIKKENQRNNRFEKYNDRVKMLSDNKIKVTDYQGSKENASYECKICCYKWSMRADRITRRPHCPYCKKMM